MVEQLQHSNNIRISRDMPWEQLAEIITNRIENNLQPERWNKDKFIKWFMLREKIGLRFDYKLVHRAYVIWQHLQDENDHFTMIVGPEGCGKSTLGMQFCSWISPNMGLDDVCYSMSHYINKLRLISADYKKEKADGEDKSILMDEGGIDLFSRESMRTSNVILNKTFMVQRFLNIHTCICLPHYWGIDKMVREHRVKTLIVIPQRRDYKTITSKGIKILNEQGQNNKKRSINSVAIPYKYWWTGHFNKEFPITISKSAYEHNKLSYIRRFLTDVKTDDVNEAQFVTIKEMSRDFKVSRMTLFKMLKEGKLNAIKAANKWLIPMKTYKTLKETGFCRVV